MNPTHCPTCKRKYRSSDKAKAFKKALRAARSVKIAKHRDSTKEIREACFARGKNLCEACRGRWEPVSATLQLDHWAGGSGRRRSAQSVENCWILCRRCHMDRTANAPSAAHWNHVFEMHCRKYGYRFWAHIEKAGLSRRGTA